MANAEMLRPYIEQTIARFLGLDSVARDADGDIPIRMGSTVCFARLFDGPDGPIFRVFAVLLSGVESSRRLLERLNELNTGGVLLRFFWSEGAVICRADVPAQNLHHTDIAEAVAGVGTTADALDDLLIEEFGASMFPDDDSTSDTVVDQEMLVAWVSEQSDIPSEIVNAVLELEFEYMIAIGIVDDPDHEFSHYSPERLAGAARMIDSGQIARDAEEMLGVPSATAIEILEGETAFLKLRGLIR